MIKTSLIPSAFSFYKETSFLRSAVRVSRSNIDGCERSDEG